MTLHFGRVCGIIKLCVTAVGWSWLAGVSRGEGEVVVRGGKMWVTAVGVGRLGTVPGPS